MFRSWFGKTSVSATRRAGRIVRHYQPCFDSLEDRPFRPAATWPLICFRPSRRRVGAGHESCQCLGHRPGSDRRQLLGLRQRDSITSLFHAIVNGSAFSQPPPCRS